MSASMWHYREGVTLSPGLTHSSPHWASFYSHSTPHHAVWCLCQCLESSRSPAACAPALSRTAPSMKKVCRYFCKLCPCLLQRVPLSHSAYQRLASMNLKSFSKVRRQGLWSGQAEGDGPGLYAGPYPTGHSFSSFSLNHPGFAFLILSKRKSSLSQAYLKNDVWFHVLMHIQYVMHFTYMQPGAL